MKIYLAHCYEAKGWLESLVVPEFQKAGFEIVSRWHNPNLGSDQGKLEGALMDIEDLKSADVLVLFVDNWEGRGGKGKWFEFGLAFGLGKRIVLVGRDDSCVFVKMEKPPDLVMLEYRWKAINWLKFVEKEYSENSKTVA